MRFERRALLTIVAVLTALIAAPQAQRGGGAPAAQTPALLQIRQAIGHGDVARARQIASGADEAVREIGLALIDIFEGKDDEAEQRLTPQATRSPGGEAALELGLLEVRRGRREQGERRLMPISEIRTFNSPDDYFKLARAAIGVREFLLAGDAFVRTKDVKRADIQTAWGDLFLRRHQPGDAMTSYQDAVKIDPDWLPAYIGMARALRDEDPESSAKVLDEVAKRSPNYPDQFAIRAELQLAEKDVAAAKQSLDKLAAARPGSVEEAALRAAVAYMEGGVAAAEAVAEKARATYPRSALPYRIAGERAADEYRFADAAVLAQKAAEIDPGDAEAHFGVGLYLMRTGDEKTARTALERSWDLDKSAPLTKNLLDVLDHLDTFTTVEAPHMIFRFSKEEAAVLRVYALPLAQTAYETFQKRYGFTPEGPILIEVFPDHDDFAVRTIGLQGIVGALGACFGRVITMDSPRARTTAGEFSWQATLWHEMAHVFSLQLSKYRVPRWLTEGISTYEEYRRVPAWGRELTLEYARALSQGKNFGVKGLPDAFKRPQDLAMAYFEASLVVEHLVDVNGEQGLRTLLLAYGDGANDEQAFAKAFGQSIDAVAASFDKFIEQRYGALREAMKVPPAAPADNLQALRARAAAAPGNYVSQLALGAALVRSGDLEGAKAPLRRAAELAPDASGDASPQALLAQIATKESDFAAARRAYRQLLTADHANVNAARRLLQVSGDSPEDEDYALRLIADLDPFDADAHARLGKRLFTKNQYEAALTEYRASLALGPANLAEAHTDVAEVLLKLGRKDEAKKAALDALKEAPTFARAQDLLLEAIGK